MGVVQGPIPTPRSAATGTPKRVPVPGKASGQYTLPDPLQAQALTEAQNSILPSVQSLAAQRASAAASAQQAQQSNTSAYDALSGILKGIAPTVGGAYHSAAVDQAAFAKGFSQGLQHLQSQAGAQTDQQLGAGTPQAAQAQAALGGTGATDALYAQGGYIPASGLTREGAAFTAAAAQLPGTAAGLGLQANQAVAAKQALTDAGFDSKQADLMAKIPGLAQTALDHLRSAQETSSYHQATLAETKAHNQAIENKPIITGSDKAGRFAIDPATGKVTQISGPVPTAPTIIGSDKSGRWMLDPATGELTQVLPPAPTGGAGKLSAAGWSSLTKSTDDLVKGLTKTTPPQMASHWDTVAGKEVFTPVPGTGTQATPYAQALAQAVARGPNTRAWVAKATQIVNAHYQMGQNGRPYTGKAAVQVAAEGARIAVSHNVPYDVALNSAVATGLLPRAVVVAALDKAYRTGLGLTGSVATSPAGGTRVPTAAAPPGAAPTFSFSNGGVNVPTATRPNFGLGS